MITLDLETAGSETGFALQPWRVKSGQAWITVSVHEEVKPAPSRISNVELQGHPTKEYFEDLLRQHDKVIGWNLTFDIAWLLAYGVDRELIYNTHWGDVMLLWQRYEMHRKQMEREEFKRFKGNKYSLGQYVEDFHPEDADYKNQVNYHIAKGELIPEDMQIYARKDIVYTTAAYLRFVRGLYEDDVLAWGLECRALPMVAEAWLEGIKIDKDAVALVEKDATVIMRMLADKAGVPATVLGSDKQLSDYLYNQQGYEPPEYTDTGQGKVDKGALKTLAFDEGEDSLPDLIRRWRELRTKKTKFAETCAKSAAYNDGYTHPQPRLVGTYSGRMTYTSTTTARGEGVVAGTTKKHKLQTGIPLHQWQKDPRIRNLLIPPDGYVLCEPDWSGQEMRLMADYSQDENMLKMFRENLNSHSFMAAFIFDMQYADFMALPTVDPEEYEYKRAFGKLANLSLQYRLSAANLQKKAFANHDTNITPAFAQTIIDKYHLRYPRVKQYHYQAEEFARTHGYAETRGGRKVATVNWTRSRSWKLSSTAINFPIQGTGGDLKSLGLAEVREKYVSKGLAKFAWDLHDALFLYLPETEAEDIAHDIKYTLSNLPYHKLRGWEPSIPLPVDCKIGRRWGELKEI